MGEYYSWVNIDKRELISPGDFGYGNKAYESFHRGSLPLLALHSLLYDEWKGDRVLWFGDECTTLKDSPISVIRELYEQSAEFGYPGDAFDMMCESYRNISCFFKEAETITRPQIECDAAYWKQTGTFVPYNEFGIDPKNPFDGLFQKTCRRCEYTINHSKKQYYSLNLTQILYQGGEICDYADPLPILMGYGRVLRPGPWLGDVIGVSDDSPAGYTLIDRLYLDC